MIEPRVTPTFFFESLKPSKMSEVQQQEFILSFKFTMRKAEKSEWRKEETQQVINSTKTLLEEFNLLSPLARSEFLEEFNRESFNFPAKIFKELG